MATTQSQTQPKVSRNRGSTVVSKLKKVFQV